MKIAVLGKMRSGKDTLAKFFIDNDNANQMAFGDGIKEVAERCFPEIVAKGKPRSLYQTIGQQFRQIEPDVWINYLDSSMEFLRAIDEENFVISDVRQRNEYDYLKEKGFTVIKVEADDDLRKERITRSGDTFKPEDFYHETETAVDSIPYDYLITNNTTLLDFYDQIQFIYEELKGEERT